MTTSSEQPGLFEKPQPKKVFGPVYQGVCTQIRTLFPKDDEDAQQRARRMRGTIAQARSLAESIDRVSGHQPGTRQATGMQLASLHERLDALLLRLDPEADDRSPVEQMADQWRQEEEAARARRAEAPHAAE